MFSAPSVSRSHISAMLDKLSYNPSSDILLHVGDIVAKGPHEGSMAVLSYMTSHNITGVRGNHDQKVIEWRAWLDWAHNLPGGKRWLTDLHSKWDKAEAQGADPDVWVAQQMKRDKKSRKWWDRIPDGWKIFSDHYNVAHAMSNEQYQYLLTRPLRLHIPSSHAFIAHAGLLPSDPRFKPYHPQQPLARVPTLPEGIKHGKSNPEATVPILRRLQEIAVLNEVPPNTDPWVVLNMRGVKDKQVIRLVFLAWDTICERGS